MSRGKAFFIGLLVLLVVPASASAQGPVEGVDPGWLPWLGCWTVVGQGVDAPEEEPSLLCVRPDEEGPGVRLVTVQDGPVTAGEPLQADGRRRESTREGCSGWEHGAFSEDGSRIYLRSEHVCPGEVERTATGMLSWISPYEWMEVRTVEVRGSPRTWVRRYRMAGAGEMEEAGVADLAVEETMAIESARMAAASSIRIDDLVEASSHLHPDGASAWLAEQADPLDLDADALTSMADAGVPGSVIDVAVAISYPDHFVVDRTGEVSEQAPAGARGGDYRDGRRIGWYGARGWYGGAYPYRPYGGLYDSFYGPWRYSGFGFGFGYRPSVVYVVPRSEAGGRVINGRGYRQGSGGGGGAVRRPGSSSGSDRSSPSPSAGRSGGGSSGGAVSPTGGYRGGSSGGDTDRKARPKGSEGSGNGSESGSEGR